MKIDSIDAPAMPKPEAKKPIYEAPECREVGSAAELTLGATMGPYEGYNNGGLYQVYATT